MVMPTQHNDNNRSGLTDPEGILNVNNVNSSQFGLLFTRAVDDKMYAQPLYIGAVDLPSGGRKNVVFAATASDTVFAFDADDPAASTPLWRTSLNPAGETPVAASDVGDSTRYGKYADMSGNVGIVGTPVIDAATNVLYVVAKTKDGSGNFFQRLHALNIASGTEVSGWPVTIAASVSGSNEQGQTNITFLPRQQNQRAALALWRPPNGGNPIVHIAWGSHGDAPPYHGWLMSYDTVTRAQVGVFLTTPNIREMDENGDMAGGGSIWQAGQGPAIDGAGNVYVMTGNGQLDEAKKNFGTSFLKLSFSPTTGLALADFFTPKQWKHLTYWDSDLGSAGPLLVAGTNVLIGGGKDGWLFPLDVTNMGHVEAQERSRGLNATGSHIGLRHIHGSPVTWQSNIHGRLVYVWGENDVLRAFKLDPSAITLNGQGGSETYAKGDIDTGCGALAIQCMPGGMLTVSAQGTSDSTAIVWAAVPNGKDAIHQDAPGRLIAFRASPSGDKLLELWRSDRSPGHASAANRTNAASTFNFAKFSAPTVVNGKVFLATFSNQLSVFGLK
jgi:hypothetical protein